MFPSRVRDRLSWVTGALLLLGCSQVGPVPSPGAVPDEAKPPVTKHISVGDIRGIDLLFNEIVAPGQRGSNLITELVHTALTALDNKGVLQPRLAEAVPSLENGLWKVFPDGRMETTWKLKPGLRWHDGTPFTSDDLLFTHGRMQTRS